LENEEPSSIEVTDLLDQADTALSMAPRAARWAEEFTTGTHLTERALQKRSAPCIVRVAVVGIADACIPDPDSLLRDLLTTVVDDCTGWLGSPSGQTRRNELITTGGGP